MDVQNDIKRNILDAVDTIVKQRIDALDLNKTIVGIIDSSIGVREGYNVYRVKYDSGYFNAIVQYPNDCYSKNMAVYVLIPQNDFSREKIIMGRSSAINTYKKVNILGKVIFSVKINATAVSK